VHAAFIDHVTILIRDYEASRAFYRGALAPWGAGISTSATRPAFRPEGSEDVFLTPGEPGAPVHFAFAAPDRETVARFHEAALAAGGRDNGGPGLRPQQDRAAKLVRAKPQPFTVVSNQTVRVDTDIDRVFTKRGP
jgi:catechol 2,3-dioxygenase-like lactoylglutathione lyase family enzyme